MTDLFTKIRVLIAKARVVLTAAPTVLSIVTGLAVYIGAEVAPHLPEAWGARVTAAVAAVLVFLRVAAEIVARLTTVLPDQRGVLGPQVETRVVAPDAIDITAREG